MCQPLVQKEHEKLLSCKLHSTNSVPKKQIRNQEKEKNHMVFWIISSLIEATFGLFKTSQLDNTESTIQLKIQVLGSTACKIPNWEQDLTVAPGSVHGLCFFS